MSKGLVFTTQIEIKEKALADYFQPVRIIYNDPVTICYFWDGTKRTATCRGTDQYNKEFGVSVCIIKKIFRRYSNFLRLLETGYEQEQKQEREVLFPLSVSEENRTKIEKGVKEVMEERKTAKVKNTITNSAFDVVSK